MHALLPQSQQTAAQVQELARSLQQSTSSQTVSDLAAAMASHAGASADGEQKLIEIIAETHKSTGKGIASSHSMFTQEVQRVVDAQEKIESQLRLSPTSLSKPQTYSHQLLGRKKDKIGLISGIV